MEALTVTLTLTPEVATDGWDKDELRRLIQEGAESGPGSLAEEVFSRLISKYETMAGR